VKWRFLANHPSVRGTTAAASFSLSCLARRVQEVKRVDKDSSNPKTSQVLFRVCYLRHDDLASTSVCRWQVMDSAMGKAPRFFTSCRASLFSGYA